MSISRRKFVTTAAAVGWGAMLSAQGDDNRNTKPASHRNRFAVATYSFWQFRPERVEMNVAFRSAKCREFELFIPEQGKL